ncbi:hypothetical protein AAC978_06515 [Desulfitobacterium sp. THU1]|uniref:hypothetical protein n=1 Tax=Desulfitobacterium sp. THU1 TaxID=3138072 RepID=UPI00311E9575
MLVMRVCQVCDHVLGELELDDLTSGQQDSIINITGNVAYALCPDCMSELEVGEFRRLN